MRQIFFISPKGDPAVLAAFTPAVRGAGNHVWRAEESDPQVIGVVEMTGGCDAEEVITALEGQGIMWLPNHMTMPNEPIKPEHAAALAKHGVLPTHTTLQAMTTVNAAAGFPPLKPKRF